MNKFVFSAIIFPTEDDMSAASSDNDTTEGRTFVPQYDLCTCRPYGSCQADNLWSIVDIRIVTPPLGSECEPGLVQCCYTGSDCGISTILPVDDPPPRSGQSEFGEFPWQILLIALPANEYVGSGALISPIHVLTVAHRVTPFLNSLSTATSATSLAVRAGDWDVRSDRESHAAQQQLVARIQVRPGYESATLRNDIAIVTLARPFILGPHLQPVCLPGPSSCFDNSLCWVSGWGKDAFGPAGNYQAIQKKVDVTVLDAEECDRRLRTTRLGPAFSLDRTTFMCAGGVDSKDACSGDGGSPLVCRGVDGRWTLAGLVAWGIGCAQEGVPGVYVNVANSLSWIQSNLHPPPFNRR
ncbi:hypothetical protein LSTR_LSTR011000 [Laodelphax striatellus]|uniref:Peptidase S1 domain-containing protein n=1 Tax=Laodelphax striatellus TaxID=195883 RepID=A0A482X5M1_LAOST|nr:hypothetical protein LSTR_LSTR011000 [Laodelphax striatellus]